MRHSEDCSAAQSGACSCDRSRPMCTCPEDNESHAHLPECPRFETCGGWTWDPPCGGCDGCILMQEEYYRSLTRDDLRRRFIMDVNRAEHTHEAPNQRCMECVTDREWAMVPAEQIDGIAEQTNWSPPDQVVFEIPDMPPYVAQLDVSTGGCRECGTTKIKDLAFVHEAGCRFLGPITDAATHGFGPDQR